jgi:hypothetical protein
MALDIIGAGFGRTGTESMKRALEMLGFGPCYHMYEVAPHPGRYEHWLSVFDDGADPKWDETFAGYRATVDWPGAHYWRELSDHYPEAKILLTVRSAESWYASMEKTILTFMRDPENHPGMARALCNNAFGGNPHDKDHLIATYERNIAEVQGSFGPDRLLTYELGSGWEPLCDFLGVPVPEEAYPRGNATEEFHRRDKELGEARAKGSAT